MIKHQGTMNLAASLISRICRESISVIQPIDDAVERVPAGTFPEIERTGRCS